MHRPATCGRVLAALLLFSLIRPAPAAAERIGFEIKASVRASAERVELGLEVRNTGDETAFSVTPRATLGGRTVSGPGLTSLAAGASHSWDLLLHEGPTAKGAYIAVVKLAYSDANAYPFEALAAAPFEAGTARRPPLRGTLSLPALATGRQRTGQLSVNAPEGRGRRYSVRLFMPRGIRARLAETEISFGEGKRRVLPVEVSNKGLLAGSSVGVIALLTSLDESTPQTDLIRGVIRVKTAARILTPALLLRIAVALAVLLLVMELLAWSTQRPDPAAQSAAVAETVLVAAVVGFLLYHYPWQSLLAATTTAGGDMASLFYPTTLMAEEILPGGRVTGWTMGNYAGFPVFHFYSTLPFVVIALVGKVLPMEQVFKLVTIAGPTTLPLAAAYLFRSLGYRRGAAALAAAATLPFLFQQGNSMWGGNIPSVLAGEFCHAIGLSLALVFAGYLAKCMQGRRPWPVAALLLAAVGLCHTYAFMAALWYAAFFLLPMPGLAARAAKIAALGALTFLLLAFWGLPLPSRLVFTTEWSMIWRIKEWTEVLPEALWPAAALASLGLVALLWRAWLGGEHLVARRQGFLVHGLAGGLLLYFLVPAIGFPDIRFVPVAQLFICLLAADLLDWLGWRLNYRTVYVATALLLSLTWAQAHLGYIPAWLKWNYSGYEGKSTWGQFESINEHLRGDLNDPRVVFEHSQKHNRFGSSRAFENLPLFSGRSTLEGVFHQASQNSPFVFYIQSEVSERGSGPFPQYTYTRLDPGKALPHLRLYNVGEIVVVTEAAKKAYDAHPGFTRSFEVGPYVVYEVGGGDTGYVVAAANEPVLYDGPDWKLAFYRWFKHHELLDVPLVPADMIDEETARHFVWTTDSIGRLPRTPIEGDCDVSSRLEQYKITVETSCPDRPHIVKVSYFPRWRARDGSELLPVSPGFMLVRPRSNHLELVYGTNAIDVVGIVLSGSGLLVLIALTLRPGLAARASSELAARLGPGCRFLEDRARLILVLVLVAAVAAATTTRLSMRNPDALYDQAHERYRKREFNEAVELFEQWIATDRDTFKQATALYQLGASYTALGHHAAAVLAHQRLRFEFPNVNYGAGTLFHLISNYAALGLDDRARRALAELADDFPGSNWETRLKRERPQLFSADDRSGGR